MAKIVNGVLFFFNDSDNDHGLQELGIHNANLLPMHSVLRRRTIISQPQSKCEIF